jgi:hypothetical protein
MAIFISFWSAWGTQNKRPFFSMFAWRTIPQLCKNHFECPTGLSGAPAASRLLPHPFYPLRGTYATFCAVFAEILIADPGRNSITIVADAGTRSVCNGAPCSNFSNPYAIASLVDLRLAYDGDGMVRMLTSASFLAFLCCLGEKRGRRRGADVPDALPAQLRIKPVMTDVAGRLGMARMSRARDRRGAQQPRRGCSRKVTLRSGIGAARIFRARPERRGRSATQPRIARWGCFAVVRSRRLLKF